MKLKKKINQNKIYIYKKTKHIVIKRISTKLDIKKMMRHTQTLTRRRERKERGDEKSP
jgi:hypothetical protein